MTDFNELERLIFGEGYTEPEVEDFSLLDPDEIARRIVTIEAELTERVELLHPKTSEGRELHSQRNALGIAFEEKVLKRKDHLDSSTGL